MVSIDVNKCVTTHMEHTTASALMVMNFKMMDSYVQVEGFYYASMVNSRMNNNNIIADFVDINECSTRVDQCEQLCENTDGSYTCACRTGFRLKSDGLQCEGMA